MAKHKVFLNLPTRELGKEDMHLNIYKDSEKLGELAFSKGGIDYYPSKSKKPIKITWSQFDSMIKSWAEQ